MKRLIIPITPIPKPRMTAKSFWSKPAKRYFNYSDELKILVGDRVNDIDWEDLEIDFILPMAKSWSKKKKAAHNGQPHKNRPDLDNLIKAIQDSLFEEDSHIWQYGRMRKIWGYIGGIEIKLKKL